MSGPKDREDVARWYRELADRLGVEAHSEYPIGKFTTMNVGGPAEWMFVPMTIQQAAELHAALKEGPLPIRVLGAGSNIIVSDKGLRAAVIATHEITGEPQREGDRVIVTAGRPIPGLVRWAVRAGLGGLEFAEGIPARAGGAIRMNAGANASCFGDVLAEVWVAGDDGSIDKRQVSADDFSYRESFAAREGLMVLAGVFQLEETDSDDLLEIVRGFKKRRRSTQPLWERSAGCVFTNWPDQPVGKLIDDLGLKGSRMGGAEVSTLHGNFIVNSSGEARASDVIALIDMVTEKVTKEMGKPPRLEVEIWRDEP